MTVRENRLLCPNAQMFLITARVVNRCLKCIFGVFFPWYELLLKKLGVINPTSAPRMEILPVLFPRSVQVDSSSLLFAGTPKCATLA